MPAKKILCPIDFSESSDGALDVAARLAAKTGGSLYVVHVMALTASVPAGTLAFGDLEAMARKAAEEGVDERVARARRVAPGITIDGTVLSGAAWEEITGHAERYGHDAIVMATRGRSGIERVLVGSVAERVVRYAPCPVFVVRGEPAFRTILCAVDFSPPCEAAMRWAADFAKAVGASLALVHVSTNPARFVDDPAAAQPDELEAWRRNASARLGAEVTAIHAQGVAWQAIIREAARFDLLVTGTMGRTGLERLVLGSCAERVVREASVSVAVVPSKTS